MHSIYPRFRGLAAEHPRRINTFISNACRGARPMAPSTLPIARCMRLTRILTAEAKRRGLDAVDTRSGRRATKLSDR
ncbi:hypothetical protein NUU61_003592 [Penicillium alfredii]|uniref:Uncharacterized protein n=1 Tax=Penicillium alfredii TaxID=1506179 RepID=A0A9W9KCH9_9EURO|nr:uncharacterized protein NUU61_003592 [Penicillium alfredii]KAJ5101370.1 hypothetical protein NUU61_003592 [Penicillium alfredii]